MCHVCPPTCTRGGIHPTTLVLAAHVEVGPTTVVSLPRALALPFTAAASVFQNPQNPGRLHPSRAAASSPVTVPPPYARPRQRRPVAPALAVHVGVVPFIFVLVVESFSHGPMEKTVPG